MSLLNASHLSADERERIAYISGGPLLVSPDDLDMAAADRYLAEVAENYGLDDPEALEARLIQFAALDRLVGDESSRSVAELVAIDALMQANNMENATELEAVFKQRDTLQQEVTALRTAIRTHTVTMEGQTGRVSQATLSHYAASLAKAVGHFHHKARR